jgi:hypothetical protein
MDGTIIAKLSSCIDAIIGHRTDFDEIDKKINLIYELLSCYRTTGNAALMPEVW